MRSYPSMKTLICALVFLTAGQRANAQEEEGTGKHYGGFGHFAGSYETVNFDALNTVLKEMGYTQLPESYLSFGGAGYFVVGNVLIGGGGASLSGFREQADSTVTSVNGGYGYGALGYLFSTGKRSFFYPSLGFAGGGFSMLVGKTGSSPDFRQQLQNPEGRMQTNTGGFFFNFQLAWQYMLGTGKKQGWSVGLKAGYKLAAAGWVMDVNGAPGVNSPVANMNGYYVSLTLGGGGLVRSKGDNN